MVIINVIDHICMNTSSRLLHLSDSLVRLSYPLLYIDCMDVSCLGACVRVMVVIVSVCYHALAATYLVYVSKVRQHTVSCIINFYQLLHDLCETESIMP